jgi:(1->4)-alpha-D-glucan 1-alpha-D-glucosylmutase
MITTATHDTKRGEDARTRLLALSEMPDAWARAWDLWRATAGPHLSTLDDEPAPDANDQWMFFQAILGAWPLELLDQDDGAAIEDFRGRLIAYGEKAMREGKRRSSWVNVDEVYEGAVKKLFSALIAPGSDFLRELRPFARRLAHLGMLASLGRTVLKCTLPGLPDTYQGTEVWDFSFVDPDNRRPVNYPALERMLEEGGAPAELLAHWPDGRVKQATLTRLLAERAERPDFYASAAYEPVTATGARADHVIAYRRTDPGQEGGDLFVAVPRLVAGFVGAAVWSGEAFAGTRVDLGAGTRWRDLVSGRTVESQGEGADLGALLRDLPYAVLRREP